MTQYISDRGAKSIVVIMNINEQQSGPNEPNPTPETDPTHDPPNPYPVEDPMPGDDPEADPIREPEPVPSFPEPIPGTPPDVLI